MRALLIAATLAALVIATAAPSFSPSPEGDSASEAVRTEPKRSGPLSLDRRTAKCVRETPRLRRAIVDRRLATWRHQAAIGVPRTRTAYRERTVIGCGYLRWSKRTWTLRADAAWRRVVELREPSEAICHVFGIYCSEAIAVAKCESGESMTPRATNGQYLGIFQMGSHEREIFGHGPTPLDQARAAYRYFVASGRDWSPWSCRWAIE